MSFPTPAFLPPTGADIPPAIQALQVVFMKTLQKGYAAARPVWEQFAQELKFDSAGKVILGSVDRTWNFEEWNGTPSATDIIVREVDLQATPYTKQVQIDAFTYADDKIGVYAGEFEIIGCNMALFPDRLLGTAMFNGTSTPWYDGANFFSASHPINPEAPTLYGSQPNYFPSMSLTWANFAYTIMPALDGMRAANNEPFNQGVVRKRKLIVPTPYLTIANTIVNSTIVPTSIQNLDGSTYGVGATDNQLKGAAEVVEMVFLDTFISSGHIPWYLFETALAPLTPFGIGMREAFRIIPLIDPRLPNFTQQHKWVWQPYGRLLAQPTMYQSAIMALS